MKQQMVIAQLRCSIFLPKNIGYTPEYEKTFKEILMPDSQTNSFMPLNTMMALNPNLPQYGMPWRLSNIRDGNIYNIAFQQGRIDIILIPKELPYGDEIEKKFCELSASWISKILEKLDKTTISRIAYAPLYAILKDNEKADNIVWNSLLKKTTFGNIQAKEMKLSFVLKEIINIGDNKIKMNYFYNFFDGVRTKNENGSIVSQNVVMFDLDLNSDSSIQLNFDKEKSNLFFNIINDIKNKLVDDFNK